MSPTALKHVKIHDPIYSERVRVGVPNIAPVPNIAYVCFQATTVFALSMSLCGYRKGLRLCET